jgi:mono/diheme cytochrome c family protein
MRHDTRSRMCGALFTLASLMGAAATMPNVLAQAAQTPARPPSAPTAAAASSELERGKAVFDEWCAGCHAPGPRHPGTQALDALYKGTKPGALEQRTDLVPKLTEQFVRKGVSVMPPFRKTEISDRELAALAAYLAPKTR